MSVKLTNNQNLPETIVNACLHDTHKVAGDISVSQLIDSPRIYYLKRTNDYTEDVADRLYMLMGTALHHIIERGNMENVYSRAFELVREKLGVESKSIKDEGKKSGMQKVIDYLTKVSAYLFPNTNNRYLVEVTRRLEINGLVLYGTPDLYDKEKEILYDYKFCSVYSYMYPESRIKWEAQTNVYAALLENDGHPVKEIRIVAFFRDWNAYGINKNKDYPKSQIMEISIRKIGQVDMVKYINKRMEIHADAREGNIPFCTGKERWATADAFAIMTKGSTKAIRVFSSKVEADDYIIRNSHRYETLHIQHRPGESRKCDRFCPVSEFCDQYKAEKEARRKASDNQ